MARATVRQSCTDASKGGRPAPTKESKDPAIIVVDMRHVVGCGTESYATFATEKKAGLCNRHSTTLRKCAATALS